MAQWTRRITLSEAVSSVMSTIGLTPPTTVVGSQDKTANQLVALATDVGQRLCDEKSEGWQFQAREMGITTVVGITTYDLPADFGGFIQDAQWNHSTRLPAIGSLTEQEWQMLKARQLEGTTFTMLFRIADDKVEFYDTPSVVQNIVLPYRSRAWAVGADTLPKDNVDANDDVILFDPQLFKVALKLAWYEAKEFDTTVLLQQYRAALSAAKSKDAPSRTLSLSQKSEYPYLGVINIPDTGYGQ